MFTLRSKSRGTWLLLLAAMLMPVSQVQAQGGRGGSNPFGGGNNSARGGGGGNPFGGGGGGGNKGFGGGGGNPFGGGNSNKSFGGGGGGNNFGGGGGNKGFGGGGSNFGGGNSNKSFGGSAPKSFGGNSNKSFGGGGNNFGGGNSAPKNFGGNSNRGGNNNFGGNSSPKNFGGGNSNQPKNFGGNKNPGGSALGGARPGGGNSKGTLGGINSPNKGNLGGSNNGGAGRGNPGGMTNKSPGSNGQPPGSTNRKPGGVTKTPGSIDRKPGGITKTPKGMGDLGNKGGQPSGGAGQLGGKPSGGPGQLGGKNSPKGSPGSKSQLGDIRNKPGQGGSGSPGKGTKGTLGDLRKPGGNNNPLGGKNNPLGGGKNNPLAGKGNPLDKKNLGDIRKGGSGNPFSAGGALGGKNRPGDLTKPGGTPNFAKTREGKKQWLSDIGKQGPNVRIGDKSKQTSSPFGRSAKRPGGLLAKSDLGIASKTAQQAQGLPFGKGGNNFKPGAANFFGGGKPGGFGGPGFAKGEPVPGTPIGGGGFFGNNNAFQGEAVTAAILTGIVVAASLAQNNQWGDAYDDYWVSPGGGFVNYVVVDDCYVYEGYNDGTYVDYGPPSTVVVNPVPGNVPPVADVAQTAPAEGATDLPFTPDGGDEASVAATTPAEPGGVAPPAPVDAEAPHVVARPQLPEGVTPPTGPAKNPLPNQVTVADRKVAKKIASEIDALLAGEVASIREQLAANLLTDETREEFLKQHITAEMDAAIVQELKNGLIDLNAEVVENAAKKLNLPTETLTTLVPRVKLTRAVNDLQKLVKEEYSTENINAFSRRFENSLSEFGLNQGLRDGLSASTAAVLDSLRIRLALDEAPPQAGGELVDAPKGEVPVLYFPPLAPAGKVYLLGGSTLGVGTATPGTLVVGRSEVRELIGVPSVDDAPVEAISVEKANNAPHDGTVLLNPSKLNTTVAYTINDTPFTIGPGQSQHLPAGTAWVIKLDRGNGTQAHYTLAEGAYTFTDNEGVRDVTSLPCDVTIENPSLTGRFNLVVDQEPVSIPPGQALSLSSSYPIVVAFDRGTGTDPVYKRLTKGTVAAGINSADGGWDLFEIEPTAIDGPEQASTDAPLSVE